MVRKIPRRAASSPSTRHPAQQLHVRSRIIDMDTNATKLELSHDANALFFGSPFDSPAVYPGFLNLEEIEPWYDSSFTTTYTSTHHSYSLFPNDNSYSYRRQEDNKSLVQGTTSRNADDSIESWIVSDNTAQDYPPAILDHDLELMCNQPIWDCPSVASDTSSYLSSETSTTSKTSRCDWPQCSHIEFNTAEERKVHTKTHARDVRHCWQPFSKCTWHNCSSQSRLKTAKLFEDHINNIHINPLLCTRDGCGHKTPFRGKADLQRHIDSVHGNTPKIRCPYRTCQSSDEKPFSRKDKLMNHLRKKHDTDPCPYQHCVDSMFSSPDNCESTAKHIGKMHGEYECALKSCYNSKSQFSEESFMAHLQLHHDISWESVLKIRDIAKRAEGRVLRDQNLVGQFEFSDCTSCTKLRYLK